MNSEFSTKLKPSTPFAVPLRGKVALLLMEKVERRIRTNVKVDTPTDRLVESVYALSSPKSMKVSYEKPILCQTWQLTRTNQIIQVLLRVRLQFRILAGEARP